jgi:hypothetical protein
MGSPEATHFVPSSHEHVVSPFARHRRRDAGWKPAVLEGRPRRSNERTA